MKKFLMAAMCCMLCAATLMAQNKGDQRPRGMNVQQMNAVPVQMVADTTISNHIGLTAKQMQKIDELNKAFVEKMRAEMAKRRGNGKTLTEEERKAYQQEAADVRHASLKELRAIMGDDKYIEYLEKSLDDMFHKTFGRAQGGQGRPAPRGGQQRGGQAGPRLITPEKAGK